MFDKNNFDVSIRDPKSWALQIQGPKALLLLKKMVPELRFENFKYFYAKKIRLDGTKYLISRTGWTGEKGFEIYTNGRTDQHEKLWQQIMSAGKELDIKFGGLDSMGIRRIEAGILDYGTDIDLRHNPFEVGLGRFVDLNNPRFIGNEALQRANKSCRLVGIRCPDSIPFSGLSVVNGKKLVGETTTGAYSPYFEEGIGFVMLRVRNWRDLNQLCLFGQDGKRYKCTLTSLPFYDREKKIPRGLQ